MLDQIAARISAEVPQLADRVAGALDFASLTEAGKLPTRTPVAYVIPAGLLGGRATAVAGGYVQDMEEVVTVMLALRSHDKPGGRAADPLRALVGAVLDSLCGWRPVGDVPGVLTLASAKLQDMIGGLVLYRIDLTIANQLRIAR